MIFNYVVTDLSSGISKHKEASSTSEALVGILADTLKVNKSYIKTRKERKPNLDSGYMQFLVVGKDYTPHFYSVCIDNSYINEGCSQGRHANSRDNVGNLYKFMQKYKSKMYKVNQVSKTRFDIQSYTMGGNDYDDPYGTFEEISNVINYSIHTSRGSNISGQVDSNNLAELYNILKGYELIH